MSGATFTITCRICGGELKTDRILEVIAFDDRHDETCDAGAES